MRTVRMPARIAAVLAVALAGVVGPVLPAAADGDRPPGVPPPIGDVPAFAQPAPDQAYTKAVECVAPLAGAAKVESKPWGQMQLRLEEAWKFAKGARQTVAVIDTGVHNHHRFGDRLEGRGDYVEPGRNGTDDCDGHGTEVAGIIGADEADSQVGFTGVAPQARIMAIRQTSSHWQYKASRDETRNAGNVNTLALAIRYAVDSGATVINVSLTACSAATVNGGSGQEPLGAALHYAVTHNVVVVAAAGNVDTSGQNSSCQAQNTDPRNLRFAASPPWFDDDVLTVGALDRYGRVPEFSLWGPWVDVAGPGTEITSLDPVSDGLVNQAVVNNKGEPIQGTSFAAPYVAGVVALVRDRFPDLTAQQVMARIKKTAQHPDGSTGRNNQSGFGMVNAVAALTTVIPEEQGIPPASASAIPNALGIEPDRDWQPMTVALIGTGTAVGLLLITLFVVRAVQRTRLRRAPQPGT